MKPESALITLIAILLTACGDATSAQNADGSVSPGNVVIRPSDGRRIIVATPIPAGTYSRLAGNNDGDTSGIILEVAGETVAVTMCERECGAPTTAVLRPGNGGWAFDARQSSIGADGQQQGDGVPMTITPITNGVILRFERDGVLNERILPRRPVTNTRQ